jgi:type IX secretion system PorP/SprF family membrane protein
MRLNRLLLILLMSPLALAAQDIHFTQFTYAPLSVNAAQTGLFEGTYRIGGLYRSQWNSGVKNGYQTPVLYVDLPIKGLRKQDWIGLGVNFARDAAGIAALTNTGIGLNAAYHIGMDAKAQNVLSIGASVGFMQRNVDRDKLRFQDGIIANGTSRDIANIDTKGVSYTDINLGANLRSKMSKTSTLNIGLSLEHVTSPKDNLINTPTTGTITATPTAGKLPLRFNIYATVDAAINKRFSVFPALIFRTAGGTSETMLHAVGGLKLDPKKNLMLRGGLGYRFGDALQVLGGIDFGDIRVGASYDYTTSTLRADTKAQDGFEIAVGYIGKIFKRPNPPAAVLCPKY